MVRVRLFGWKWMGCLETEASGDAWIQTNAGSGNANRARDDGFSDIQTTLGGVGLASVSVLQGFAAC